MIQTFNALGRLKRENNLAARKLSYPANSELREMVSYVRAKGVGMYEAEEFRKDMIGMMLDAAARGELPGETIGAERKEFCDSVAKNSPKRRGEPFLYVAYMLSIVFLGSVTAMSLLFRQGLWETGFPVTANTFVVFGYFGILMPVFSEYVRPRFPSFRKGNLVSVILLAVAIFVIYMAFYSWSMGGEPLFTVSKPLVLGFAIVFFVVMWLAWRLHIARVARKAPAES